MPAIPPDPREWLTLLTQPAVILIGVGLIVNQQNRLIDALSKRVDELREDQKETQGKVDDLRDEVKGLPLKIVEMLSKAPR